MLGALEHSKARLTFFYTSCIGVITIICDISNAVKQLKKFYNLTQTVLATLDITFFSLFTCRQVRWWTTANKYC